MAGSIIGPLYGETAEDSRDSSTRELGYTVIDTDDPDEAYALLAAEAPSVYRSLPLSSTQLTGQGGGAWAFTVRYGRRPKGDTIRMRGTTKGGTAHRTHSFTTVNKYWRTGTPDSQKPDFKNAINVENGEAKGVEYPVPIFPFSIDAKIDPADLPSNYLVILLLLTGTKNDVIFTATQRGQTVTFAVGELMFKGADWDLSNDDEASFVYDFEASPNATGLVVGDITGIVKEGWDYLWAMTDPTPTNGAMVPLVRGVFVESIIPTAISRGVSFNDLIFS